MKPGAAPLKSIRLRDQVRERIRYLHYSLSTEKVYLYWVKFFVLWQAQQPGGMRHPRDMVRPQLKSLAALPVRLKHSPIKKVVNYVCYINNSKLCIFHVGNCLFLSPHCRISIASIKLSII